MREVLPEKFTEQMRAMLGEEEYAAFLGSYDAPRFNGLRVNTLKISPEEFVARASFKTLRPVPWCLDGFYVDYTEHPGQHPYYAAGLYYLQEPSAMAPASVLPVNPGEKVLDLCAAPGGKATALAAKLKGEGVLVANEINSTRARALLRNLELFGVPNAYVTNAVPEKLAAYFHGYFDKILIDAPCSGEGMFRKDPEAIKTWSGDKVRTCAGIQRGLLDLLADMLKPGGMAVYSTCTFAPEEDEAALAWLLTRHPEMHLVEISLPQADGNSMTNEQGQRVSDGPEQTVSDGPKQTEDVATEDSSRKDGGITIEHACSRLPQGFSQGFSVEKLLSVPLCDDESRAALEKAQEMGIHLEKSVRIWPHKAEGEGHFLALICKDGPSEAGAEGTANRSAAELPEAVFAGLPGDGLAGNSSKKISGGNLSTVGAFAVSGDGLEKKKKEKKGRRNQDARDGRVVRNSAKGGSLGGSRGSKADGAAGKRFALEAEFLVAFDEKLAERAALGGLEEHNGQVYLPVDGLPQTSGITYLRSGLYLGEEKRGRFEPSQPLAMALCPDRQQISSNQQLGNPAPQADHSNTKNPDMIDLHADDPRVARYLRGETLQLTEEEADQPSHANGWKLVTVDGAPLGWGKQTVSILKNKYFAAWRREI